MALVSGDMQSAAPKLERSLEALNTAAQLRPASSDIALNRAKALLHLGRATEAMTVLQPLVSTSSLQPDERALALYELAQANAELSNLDAAEKFYRDAIIAKPSYAPARVALADLLSPRAQ